MIYADTSALAKLVTVESESAALRTWIGERSEEPMVTNAVGAVELRRLAGQLGAPVAAAVTVLLHRIDQLEVTGATYALAGDLPPASLRTLDALHVASAAQAPEVTAFLTYDRRMADAAGLLGLPVVMPGLP